MKRFLCVAMTAVMLMASMPAQVSSEGEVLLTLVPVETAAQLPALAEIPAVTPSPTPSPSPAPAAEEPIVVLEIVEMSATPAPEKKIAAAPATPAVPVTAAAPETAKTAAPEKNATEVPTLRETSVTAQAVSRTEEAGTVIVSAPETAALEETLAEVETLETVEITEAEAESLEIVEIVEAEPEEIPEAAETVAPAPESLELTEIVEAEPEDPDAQEAPAPETEEPETVETVEIELDALDMEELSVPLLMTMEEMMASDTAMLADGSTALAAPRVGVSSAIVKNGEQMSVSYYPVANATTYNVKIYNKNNRAVLDQNFEASTSGKRFTFTTNSSIIGLNRLVVTASAEGYTDGVGETTFRTAVIELTASAASVETGTAYTLAANAPDAKSLTLYEDGKALADGGWSFTKYSAGSHTYRLEAAFDEGSLTEETTVAVTASKGALVQAAVTVPDTVTQGEDASFTVGAVDNATRYIVNVQDAGNKAILQDTAETAKTYTLQADQLSAGAYRIAVTAQAAGYEASLAEKSFTVVEPVKHEAVLTVDKTEVGVGENAVLSLSAPEADSAVLYSKAGDAEEKEEKAWTGEIPATYTVTSDTEGSVAYRLEAKYGEETKTSETVTVSFVSHTLAAPEITLSTQSVKVGESVDVTVKAVENAASYLISVYEASGDKRNEINAEVADQVTVRINTAAYGAGVYNVVVLPQAEGYTGTESTASFRVVEVTLAADPLIVDVGAEYTVTVTAEDAEAVNLFREGEEIPVDEWEDGEEFTFTDSSDEETEYVYTAEARYGDKWFTSNTVTVQVKNVVKLTASAATVETGTEYTIHGVAEDAESSVLYENDTAVSGAGPDWKFTKFAAGQYTYRLEGKYGDTVKKAETTVQVTASKGSLSPAVLEFSDTVELNQNLRVYIGAVRNAETYSMLILDASGRAVARVPDPKPGSFSLPTGTTLTLGTYTMKVTAQAAGYNESVAQKNFTIVEAVDHTLTLTPSKTSVATMETYTLTISAPGADAMELIGVNQAGQNVYYETWENGGTETVSVSCSYVDTITYALMGQFNGAWEESDPVEIKVSAAQGNLAASTLNYPYQVATGTAVNVTFTAVPNATRYELRMINAATGGVAASTTKDKVEAWQVSGLPDGHYILELEATAPNYNASLTKGSLHVGAIDQTVAFTVANATVETGEAIELDITAPHADQLRLYVKEGSAAEKLEATFDYTDYYVFTHDTAGTLNLRLEGLLNGSWVKASAERKVTVTATKGNLKAPVVDVASQIKKGDTLIFTVTKADNAATQLVTIGLKSGSSVSKVYDGAAVGRTFKIDTSKLAEGEYVITASAAAPGYNAASATTSVYVGTPATATPTAKPTATATTKPTATVKPTATPKRTATKKPTATPKVTVTANIVVTPTVTPSPMPTTVLPITPAPAPISENGIMYREAINVQETYGVDTSTDLDAFFILLDIGEEMNITAAANGTRYTIAHVESLLNDNERQVYATLKPKDKLFVAASVIGMNQFVDLLDSSEFSIETWVLIDDIQMRVDAMSEQERQERSAQIQRLFGQPATPNGNAVYALDVTISNGVTTRYERYTFRKDELWDWLLYKIYIGTAVS
ncbi:MAG: hypothetical protein IJU12_00710 [Clostridia bacterium]|nr:hypothetical protein [Clostridia bacterium]